MITRQACHRYILLYTAAATLCYDPPPPPPAPPTPNIQPKSVSCQHVQGQQAALSQQPAPLSCLQLLCALPLNNLQPQFAIPYHASLCLCTTSAARPRHSAAGSKCMQLGTLQLGTDTDDAVLTDRLANVFA